jgi:NAD(P)-dependent dehydrogenase (short-subunit alcohol dehydrogenase family)
MPIDMTNLSIALLGATGGTGFAIAKRALAKGHRVHALVRNEAKLAGLFGEGGVPSTVHMSRGDATSESDVARLLEAAKPDVLVLAVGTTSLEKNTICFDAAVAVARAAARAHFQGRRDPPLHVIAVSGGGLGGKPGFLMEKLLVPALLKEPLFDALQMEAALKTPPSEVLAVTIVRPYRLTDGEASSHWHVVEEDFHAPIVIRYTTRADVAESVIVEAETREHAGKIINVYTGGV